MALYVDGVKVTSGEVHYGDRVKIDLNSSRTALDITQRGSGKYLSMHDGTEPTWGHSPLLAVEGVAEFDASVYLDNTLVVAGSTSTSGLRVSGLIVGDDGTTPTWGHSPTGLAVEGVSEFDAIVYLDNTLVVAGSIQGLDYWDVSASTAAAALTVHLRGGAGDIYRAKDSGSVLAMRILSSRLVNIGASGTSVCGVGADDALFGGKAEVAGTAYLRGLVQVGNVAAAGHSPAGLHVAGVNEFDGRTYLDDVLSAAGSAAFHDGTEPTWGHSPRFGVEGVAEYDSKAWFDDAVAVAGSAAITGAVTIEGTLTPAGAVALGQDKELHWANRSTILTYSACDANATNLRLELYAGELCVPVLTVGIVDQDTGLFDGLTQPLLAVLEKNQQIAKSACGTHTGLALSRLIQSGDFGSATVGDIVRITAGTCVLTGWYWVDDTPAASAVVLDHNFVAATTTAASDVAFVLYHNFPMMSGEGVKLKVFDGAPGDGNIEIDAAGWTGWDAKNDRLYVRSGSAWNYIAKTAGFEVAANETRCPNCGQGILNGQRVIGEIDGGLTDGALHGRWVHEKCPRRK